MLDLKAMQALGDSGLVGQSFVDDIVADADRDHAKQALLNTVAGEFHAQLQRKGDTVWFAGHMLPHVADSPSPEPATTTGPAEAKDGNGDGSMGVRRVAVAGQISTTMPAQLVAAMAKAAVMRMINMMDL